MNASLKRMLNREPLRHVVKEHSDTAAFPMESAYLCQDCNAIGNDATRCPICASAVLMGLSAVLNRVEGNITPGEKSYQKHLDTHRNTGYSVFVSQ